jgi:HEAT repeat protein
VERDLAGPEREETFLSLSKRIMKNERASRGRAPGDLRRPLEKLLREFHAASRIFTLYPSGHAALKEAAEAPYRTFREIFEFKKSVYLEGAGNYLIVEDICLRSGDLVREVLSDLDLYGVNSLLFGDTLSEAELFHLLSFLCSKREGSGEDLQSHLGAGGVSSIEVNTVAFGQIAKSGGDFSAFRERVGQLLKKDPARLAKLLTAEEGLDEKATSQVLGFEIHSEVARKLIAEDAKRYSAPESAEILKRVLTNLELSGLSKGKRGSVLHEIVNTFSSGRDQTDLLRPLLDEFLQAGWTAKEVVDALEPEAAKRWTLLDKSEEIISTFKEGEQKPPSSEEFRGVVEGFSSTGDWQKLSEFLEELSQVLQSGTEEQKRRVALYLTGVLGVVSEKSPERFLRSLVRHSRDLYLKSPGNDTEVLILELGRELILMDCFQLAKEVLSVLEGQRAPRDSKSPVYDEGQTRSQEGDEELVEKLISQIKSGDHEAATSAVELILTLGPDQAFRRLTDIFTDPNKSVRMASLKALRSGGEAALKACNLLLRSEELKMTSSGDGPLPDEEWYKVRNALFVIGELRDPESINPLLKWSECADSRVRHEVTTATEKIGGEQAAKLLLILADDRDPKVRNRAVVALGQIGTTEEASDLVTISERHPDSLSTVVKTLGRLGGVAARDFLFAVLEDDRFLKEMGVPKKEVPELRILTLKAIAQIGDEISLSKLREYSERKATPAGLLKRKDNLQATAASLLRQTDQRKSPTVRDLTHQR